MSGIGAAGSKRAVDCLISHCSWLAWELLAIPPEPGQRHSLDFWRINGSLGSYHAQIREGAD